jgi:hypothetical protein
MPPEVLLSDSDFKVWVVQALTRLSTQMESVVGNGQPGRIGTLEERVMAQAVLISAAPAWEKELQVLNAKVQQHEKTLAERAGVSKVWMWLAGIAGTALGAVLQWLLAAHPQH